MTEQCIQKLQDLYKTGRYECDVWFYQNLMLLVKSMQMYEFVPLLNSNIGHVKKIHKLIEQNSDSLSEDFDEDEAALKAEQIKKQIHQINTKHIETIMNHLQKQRYLSYTHHAAKLIQKYNYHPKYQLIVQHILNTVYDPILRLEYVMVCTLFMLRNTQKIDDILNIYEKSIENALNVMKIFRKNSQKVKKVVITVSKKIQEVKNLQKLTQNQKINVQKIKTIFLNVQNYCYGIYFIYTTTVKLCDLVKILQSKNNFILKLNSYKPDVEQIIELWEHFRLTSQNKDLPKTKIQLKAIQKQMEYMPVKQLQQLFIGQKSGIQRINRTCKICLRYIHKEETQALSTAQYHKICQATVKQLLQHSNNEQHR